MAAKKTTSRKSAAASKAAPRTRSRTGTRTGTTSDDGAVASAGGAALVIVESPAKA